MELLPIANRAADGEFHLPADNWIQIVPIGEFPHEKSGLTQVLDRVAIETMAQQFRRGSELLIDVDHESLDSNKRTTAYGWVQNLEARSDGLYANVRWSRTGAEAVKGGDFRYISPVFLGSECESLGDKRIRPLRLDSAGLTNRPNLRGIAALANREETEDPTPVKARPEKLFTDHVRERMVARKIPFGRAWEETKEEESGLYRELCEVFANTAACPVGLKNKIALGQDIVPMTCPPAGAIDSFENKVKACAALQKCSYEVAFEKTKLTHPADFANAVRLGELLHAQRAAGGLAPSL